MEEEIGSINIHLHHHHQGYGYEAESSSCINEGESKVSSSGNNINIISSNYEEIINNNNDEAQYYYCYSLLEAMPLPGPTWSTTPPSLLDEPPASSSSSTIEECCWLGFLEGLEDNGKMVISSDDDHLEELDHTLLGLGDGVVDSNNINNNKVSSNELSSPFVDELLELSYCPDEWLVSDTTIGE